MSDEAEIRQLIERWAGAVHAGDLDGVLADHAPGIVMFDVPPPSDGVRGLDAYRDVWPGFFAWQASGAVFEIVELAVTAGSDVAFAHALLRCGTKDDFDRAPDNHLRLTIGLEKRQDRWQVTHEHHSFADPSNDPEAEREIRRIHETWFAMTRAKNLDGIMAHIADDVVSYEHGAPLAYVGVDAVREVCGQGLASSPGLVTWDVPDLRIVVRDTLAVAWGLNRMTAERPDGTVAESWSRGTRVFRKQHGGWSMIHQHVSFPQD